jgi:hypothetical protein
MHNYDKITERIKELASDPEALSAHIQNNVQGIQKEMPNIAQAMSSHIVRTVNYLHSKIPKPNTVLPLMPKWEASQGQKDKFERHYNAVNNPTDVLHHIANGELSHDTLEALQAVHPDLLQEMQHKVKTQIQPDVAAKLPNHVKRGLSQFLGAPLESHDLQSVKAANQAMFQAQQQAKVAQQQNMGKTTQKGLSELSVSKRIATDTQKDEEDS